MKRMFFGCLLAALGLLVATDVVMAQSSSCTDVDSCFQSAIRDSETVTMGYSTEFYGSKMNVVGGYRCKAASCVIAYGPADWILYPEVRKNFPVLASRDSKFGVDGQGFHQLPNWQRPATYSGFSTLRPGLTWHPVKNNLEEFTVAVTFFAGDAGSSQEIFSLAGDEDGMYAPFTASWDGRLILETIQADGYSYTVDVPWDMTADVVDKGISPYNLHTDDWERKPKEPDVRLVELYFRFSEDGKLRIDMASLRAYSPELLVSHTVDMGLPVYEYPTPFSCEPPAGQRFCEVLYVDWKGLRLGSGVTQISFFDRRLLDDEVMAFHVKNFYFKEAREPYSELWNRTLPCNSGEWMNITRDWWMHTPCASRHGTIPPPP